MWKNFIDCIVCDCISMGLYESVGECCIMNENAGQHTGILLSVGEEFIRVRGECIRV